LLSPALAIWFDCGLLAVLCCHLATENVMKLLFLAFGYVAARGRGLLCRAPQLVLALLISLSTCTEQFTGCCSLSMSCSLQPVVADNVVRPRNSDTV